MSWYHPRLLVLVLWLSPCLILPACVEPAPRAATPGASRGVRSRLLHTAQIEGNFLMQQELRFRHGQQEGSFEAVVQKHCDEVVVIGLTPFGTRAFSIRQRGLEVAVENQLVGKWPFPPENILLDVQRSFLYPIAQPPLSDGVHEATVGAELVRDRWSAGRLLERRIRAVAGPPEGEEGEEGEEEEIVVRYLGGTTRGSPARNVELRNERHGYEINITTHTYRPLVCSD